MTPLSSRVTGFVRGLDRRIVIVTLAMSLLGILFILCATAGLDAREEHAGAGIKQIRWLVVSVLVVGAILAVPYRWIVERAYVLYVLALVALVAVLFLGYTKNGSTRWMVVFQSGSLLNHACGLPS